MNTGPLRLLVVSIVSLLLLGGVASAAVPNPKPINGLQITPVRDEQKVNAGSQTDGSIVVANLTSDTITVTLQVKQFSVTDFNYDYRFSNPGKPWVHLGLTELTLSSQQSKTVPYTLTPDVSATPGGYYYSVVASTKTTSGSVPSVLQAVSLLYITINGKLTHTGTIENVRTPKIVFGNQFDVSVEVKNTGNTYYFAAISGHVKGPLTGASTSPQNHLLIPQKPRRVSSSLRSPALPGIYPVNIKYTADNGTVASSTQYVLFVQPWSLAVFIAVILFLSIIQNRQRSKSEPSDSEA
jgi:uncharacterized membrane protein